MKILKVVFYGIVALLICVSSVQAADLQDEIFGLKWGTRLSGLNGFSKIWSKGNIDFYRKPGEVRTINDLDVREVIYGFCDNQFFAVYIKIDSIEVFDDFRRYMKTKYGIPQQTIDAKNDLTVYRWKYKDIKTKLKIYEKSNTMKLSFYYTPLSNKVNEELQEKLQNESLRFLPIEKDKRPERMPLLQF